jgi:hypothetical protein
MKLISVVTAVCVIVCLSLTARASAQEGAMIARDYHVKNTHRII